MASEPKTELFRAKHNWPEIKDFYVKESERPSTVMLCEKFGIARRTLESTMHKGQWLAARDVYQAKLSTAANKQIAGAVAAIKLTLKQKIERVGSSLLSAIAKDSQNGKNTLKNATALKQLTGALRDAGILDGGESSAHHLIDAKSIQNLQIIMQQMAGEPAADPKPPTITIKEIPSEPHKSN